MTRLVYVFVHGLSGWGSYDAAYQRMPYWGMRGGDLMVYLRSLGFDCAAASVAPAGSAWDRACELYAQIAGTCTDYGEAHSRKYGHERFGIDFTGCPLIREWNDDTRLVLLGHSFGGATVRMFSQLLAHGDVQEQGCGPQVSPLFAGGMGDRIHSIVTIASPMNGTTAYDLFRDPSFDPSKVKVPALSRLFARMMSSRTKPEEDDRDVRDYAAYDMHVDNAEAMNAEIDTLPHVFYYSVPCSFTVQDTDGTWKPLRGMEPLFVMRSYQIGAYRGMTESGTVIDESWRQNDGLVNTISAAVPSGAPSVPLDRDHPQQGTWNVFPVYKGDHMALQGGLMHRHDIRGFYAGLLNMIERTAGDQ